MKRSRSLRTGLIFSVLVGSVVVGGQALGWMPATVRIPIVREHGKGDPEKAALFSHWGHNQYFCYTCHPTLFPQAAQGFTHDELDDGKFCAVCHSGRIAKSIDDMECTACHRD